MEQRDKTIVMEKLTHILNTWECGLFALDCCKHIAHVCEPDLRGNCHFCERVRKFVTASSRIALIKIRLREWMEMPFDVVAGQLQKIFHCWSLGEQIDESSVTIPIKTLLSQDEVHDAFGQMVLYSTIYDKRVDAVMDEMDLYLTRSTTGCYIEVTPNRFKQLFDEKAQATQSPTLFAVLANMSPVRRIYDLNEMKSPLDIFTALLENEN